MRITNMRSKRGNAVPNQFIIDYGFETTFQSYRTTIAKKLYSGVVELDEDWVR